MDWAKKIITDGFVALERELELVRSENSSQSHEYCFGETLTIADCFLVPQVYNAARFQVDMEKFPLISKLHARLGELEPFKKAHPSVQPDAQ